MDGEDCGNFENHFTCKITGFRDSGLRKGFMSLEFNGLDIDIVGTTDCILFLDLPGIRYWLYYAISGGML